MHKSLIFFAGLIPLLMYCTEDPPVIKPVENPKCVTPATCIPADGEPVEFVCPVERMVLQSGIPANIGWVVDRVQAPDGLIYLSLDSGKSWVEEPLLYIEETYSDQFLCDSFEWTPPQVSEPIINSCRLKYTVYTDPGTTYAISGFFSIVP